MLQKLLAPEIRELIAQKDEQTLRETLDRWLPADVAALLGELTDEEDLAGFRLLSGPQRVQIFEYLDRPAQRGILFGLPPEDVRALLMGMAADDRTALLEELETEDRERFLQLLSDEERAVAETLLHYPPDSVGRLMTPNYVTGLVMHFTIALVVLRGTLL